MKSWQYDVTLVVPLLNEEESLKELIPWIARVCSENRLRYEIILVNDGSTDNSWEVIRNHAERDAGVKALSFTRNYGKSAALNEGFKIANGEVIITMDADLQDSPDEIPELRRMIVEDGYHLVSGWKKKRHDPISKTLPSKFYNFFTRVVSGIKLHDFNCGLKAYHHKVIKNVEIYGEMHRYIPYIAKANGFKKIGEKVVEHRARKYGYSKFGIGRILGLFDLLAISFVSKYSKKPMQFFGAWGTLSFIAGLLGTGYLITEKVYNLYTGLEVREIVDQPAFFMALTGLIIGVQLFLAGYLGEMMVLNNASKSQYVIDEMVGLE